jgi:hypothetical protein
MRWITHNRLIKVAYLYIDLSISVCQRAKVAKVAIATNPNARSVWQGVTMLTV